MKKIYLILLFCLFSINSFSYDIIEVRKNKNLYIYLFTNINEIYTNLDNSISVFIPQGAEIKHSDKKLPLQELQKIYKNKSFTCFMVTTEYTFNSYPFRGKIIYRERDNKK